MRSLKTTALLCGILPFIAGCGGGDGVTQALSGGGGGGGGAGGSGGFGQSYQSVGMLGDGVFSSNDVETITSNFQWFASNLVTTGAIVENIPATGRATYNGWMSLNKTTRNDPNNTPDDLYYGRVQLNADFAAAKVNGSMGDFGKIDPRNVGSNGYANPQSVNGIAFINGDITDQFMGTTTNKGMYATVNGILEADPLTGDLSGFFYTETATGRKFMDGGGNLNVGSDIDTDVDFIAAQ